MRWMESKSTLVIFALISALGLVMVVAVDMVLTSEEADAQKPRGCNRSVARNASQGRCVEPGVGPQADEADEADESDESDESDDEEEDDE